jgi:thiamine pyrophosphate-dependent acetolactate synthase large subunit-like protein
LPGDHPNVVTLDGALLTEVNELIAGADVVLAVGTMFKQEDTANWMTKVGQQLIHIDLDPAEIGRSYPPTIGIVADARAALLAILEEMPERKPAETSWLQQGQEAAEKRLAKRRAKSPMDIRALDILRNAVPREGIVVCDRCNLGYWAWRCMPAYASRTFQYPLGYGALGGALPQAIGAKLACPEKPVVCVIGDGGFQFTGTELAIAVQEQVSITIVLCNNRSYGAIQAKQDRDYGRRFGNVLVNPDFQLFATAYGVPALRADNLDSFEEQLNQTVSSNKLSLIELTFDISDP